MAKTPVSTTLTAKQVERLMKLIALANNNSADNEANSAARAACKMLDGYIFMATNFSVPNPPPPPTPPKQEYHTWGSPFGDDKEAEDYFSSIFGGAFRNKRYGTYEKPKESPKQKEPKGNEGTGRTPPGSERTAKQGAKETQQKPHQDFRQSKTGTDPYDDFKRAYKEAQSSPKGPTKEAGSNQGYNPTGSQRDFWRNFTSMSDEEFLRFTRARRDEQNPNKKVLTCTKCRKDIETGYVGHPGGFVCFQCQFKEHNY